MAKISAISGFPEWLPAEQRLEQQMLDLIRHQFELFGFTPLQTRAIEPLSVLLSKSDDKEIYVLKRLHDTDLETSTETGSNEKNSGKNSDEKIGLHFDLTLPFARYVQEFQHALVFPFKRYQIQKVWRGERKQEGRYREFYQCDIDVIGNGSLPLAYDAEFPLLLTEVMGKLPIPPVCLKINNRKILEGFYRGLGVAAVSDVMRLIDKLSKLGESAVRLQLQTVLGLTEQIAEHCVSLARIQSFDTGFRADVEALGVVHPLLTEGLDELESVMRTCQALPTGSVCADLSIARGLDYYTGTVYEGYLVGHESMGAVCSGGRYDNLASGGRLRLPGIGVSIGLTRILGYLFGRGLLTGVRATPVVVLVILENEASRSHAFAAAQVLRSQDISTDVYHAAHDYGRQIQSAEKRGIPYVLFITEGQFAMKDLRTGMQTAVDLESWQPSFRDEPV